MAQNSKIEWTNTTWNPVTGCTPASEGCTHCYAERMARRLNGRHGYPPIPRHFDVTLHPNRLEEPLKWRKPRMVFVCSMGDLFHEDVPTEYIKRVWLMMGMAVDHTFQVLTKRPKRMRDFILNERNGAALINVWLGVTAENQARADERVPLLLETPAAVRFVSCEPLLGPVDFGGTGGYLDTNRWCDYVTMNPPGEFEAEDYPALDWVIAGGETGPGARPMHSQWARSLRDQCVGASVPFFFKQWGGWAPYGVPTTPTQVEIWGRIGPVHVWPDDNVSIRVGKKHAGRLLDGRTWDEFPAVAQTVKSERGRHSACEAECPGGYGWRTTPPTS